MTIEKIVKREPQFFRKPWSRLSDDEKKEIIEKSILKKEEIHRKENKKKADIIQGKQRTQDNSWE